jgi:4-hydroxy-tetrahydrodipicolinate synthase
MLMKTQHFRGTWTALITPFKDDDAIDYDAVNVLIDKQIEGGVTGILVIGTTGESPTLSDDECDVLVKHTVAYVNGRCLVMAGTGTNSTKKSIEKTKRASALRPDVLLVVNPYYNKPTQRGLYLHFKAVAEATDLPVLVYNIKGRTAINVETDTLMKLAEDVQNIIGVKEASGDLDQIKAVCDARPDGFVVLSGDDGITFQTMKDFGVDGVVSVTSNVLPKKVSNMVTAGLEKKWDEAEALNTELQEFFSCMFIETNPIPVKYAVKRMGLCTLKYRLPMCEPSDENKKAVGEVLKKFGLI